jgi:hypothetical protein
MKKYCFDTSGLSNPLEAMPRDIHVRLWDDVVEFMGSGVVAVTKEILDEIVYIPSGIGDFAAKNSDLILLEVGQAHWDWGDYLEHNTEAQNKYQGFISEFNKDIKGTIGLNDLSLISLARVLKLPIVSMEKRVGEKSPNKRRIPDICDYEGIEHLDFNDFLRRESFKF